MYQNDPMKVLTGEVRLSYVHLSAPYVNPKQPNSEPKYSVTLLIPKSDMATKADIDAAINAAINEAVGKKWGGVRPPIPKIPIWDGDGVRQNGAAFGEECKGHWVITASTKNKPQVVDQSNISCELAPQDIYSGMYARVTVRFFGYDNSGSRGIGCGLGNVMKTRDGEPLSGSSSAASDFAGVGQNVADSVPYGATVPANAPVFPASTAPYVQGYSGYGPNAAAAPTQGYTPTINPITGLPM